MKRLTGLLFGGLVAVGIALEIATPSNAPEERAQRIAALEERLSYLHGLPEVKKVVLPNEGSGNNVVIVFRNDAPRTHISDIVRAAAFHSNKRIDFGAHVWAVPLGAAAAWPPDQIICSATARYGKVEKSDC